MGIFNRRIRRHVRFVQENADEKVPLCGHIDVRHGQHEAGVRTALEPARERARLDRDDAGGRFAHFRGDRLTQLKARSELKLRGGAGAQERFELFPLQLLRPLSRGGERAGLELVGEDGVQYRDGRGHRHRVAVFIYEVGNREVSPGRVVGIRIIQIVIPMGPQAVEHVVMGIQNRIARRKERAHVAADESVDIVVGCSFEHACRVGSHVQVGGRGRAARKQFEVRLIQDALDHAGADIRRVRLVRLRNAAIGVIEGTRGVPKRVRDRRMRGPVPVRQRKGVVSGQLAADALQISR